MPNTKHSRELAITGISLGHPSLWHGSTEVSLIKAKDASRPAPKEMRGEGGLESAHHPSPYCFIHVLSGSLAFASCSLSIT